MEALDCFPVEGGIKVAVILFELTKRNDVHPRWRPNFILHSKHTKGNFLEVFRNHSIESLANHFQLCKLTPI